MVHVAWWLSGGVVLLGMTAVCVYLLLQLVAEARAATERDQSLRTRVAFNTLDDLAADVAALRKRFDPRSAPTEPARLMQWQCPCCCYQFSVQGNDARIVVHEWTIGRDAFWRVVVTSHGVETQIHQVDHTGCSRQAFPR